MSQWVYKQGKLGSLYAPVVLFNRNLISVQEFLLQTYADIMMSYTVHNGNSHTNNMKSYTM